MKTVLADFQIYIRFSFKSNVQDSRNLAKEFNSNNGTVFVKIDFHKHGKSFREHKGISHEKVYSKLENLEKEKRIFTEEIECLYKKIQGGKRSARETY